MSPDAHGCRFTNRQHRARPRSWPDFCQGPGARLLLYYWEIMLNRGVGGRVECFVVRSMENGEQRGGRLVYRTSLDQGIGNHMTICIGYVLIHIGGLDRSVFFMLYIVMFCYFVRCTEYKFCVSVVQGGPSRDLTFGLVFTETSGRLLGATTSIPPLWVIKQGAEIPLKFVLISYIRA